MSTPPQPRSVVATQRPCVELEIPAGPGGLDLLMPALSAALDGTGPAIGLLPGYGAAAWRSRVRAAVAPEAPVSADVAVVAATSGSTGDPAGVLLPGRSLRAAAEGFSTLTGQLRGHRWVCALPLHSAAGLMVAVRSVVAGTTPVAMTSLGGADRFSVDAFAAATRAASDPWVQDDRPLAVSLVPPMLAMLDAAGTSGVELLQEYDAVIVGGAPPPPDLVGRLRYVGVKVMTSYGMTETCGGVAYDGRPLDDVAIEVEPSGRLVVTGTQVAGGYRDGREAERWTTTTHGVRRFRTGDLGRIDHQGTLTVTGRLDDVVQVAGTSVALNAVRSVLVDQPAVADAEVVALPDPVWGSHVVAAVVPSRVPGARLEQATVQALAEAVQQALGRAARPRDIRLVPRLPRMDSGKVDRRALLQWASDLERVQP